MQTMAVGLAGHPNGHWEPGQPHSRRLISHQLRLDSSRPQESDVPHVVTSDLLGE